MMEGQKNHKGTEMERRKGTDAQMEEFSGTVMDSKMRTIIQRRSSTQGGGEGRRGAEGNDRKDSNF